MEAAIKTGHSEVDAAKGCDPSYSGTLKVHDNVADPVYGTFYGNYGRHFLADFDILF